MKTVVLVLIGTFIFLSACSPSPAVIETAIAQTQAARPAQAVDTPEPTPLHTPSPTNTPANTPTPVLIEDGDFGSDSCVDFIQRLDDVMDQWNDAMQVAARTQRIALSDRIVDLQNIRRDARQIEEPLCGERLFVKDKLLTMMDGGIGMFSEFLVDRERAYAVERAFFDISSDLFFDAWTSLNQETYELPLRVHYYVYSWETGLRYDYADENGEMVSAGRIGFNDMPAIHTFVLSGEDEIDLILHLYDGRVGADMSCSIFVNGLVVNERTDSRRNVVCAFEP